MSDTIRFKFTHFVPYARLPEKHSVDSPNRRIPRTISGAGTWPAACAAEAASSEFDAPGYHEPRSSNGWFLG